MQKSATYQALELRILTLEQADVITTSGTETPTEIDFDKGVKDFF